LDADDDDYAADTSTPTTQCDIPGANYKVAAQLTSMQNDCEDDNGATNPGSNLYSGWMALGFYPQIIFFPTPLADATWVEKTVQYTVAGLSVDDCQTIDAFVGCNHIWTSGECGIRSDGSIPTGADTITVY